MTAVLLHETNFPEFDPQQGSEYISHYPADSPVVEQYPEDFFEDEVPNYHNGDSVLGIREAAPIVDRDKVFADAQVLADDYLDHLEENARGKLFTSDWKVQEEGREALQGLKGLRVQMHRPGNEQVIFDYAMREKERLEQERLKKLAKAMTRQQTEAAAFSDNPSDHEDNQVA